MAMPESTVERAARLTREKIAPRAARYDREARNPLESWTDLWREGFLGLAIPHKHGGMDCDMPTYLAVIETIARGCSSTAMTLHMHSTVMRFIATLGTADQQRRYFAEVVERGKLLGSWGSEPALSQSRSYLMETTLRARGDGYVIDGTKHFCTMALGAAYYMVWCALDGDSDMNRSLYLALLPADTPGIVTDGKWDTLGMRATFSPTVRLQRCRVAADAILGNGGASVRAGVIEAFALGYGAIYVGIAQGAIDFLLNYCKTRVFKPDPNPIAHEPAMQRHVGELSIQLEAARGIVQDAGRRWEQADPPTRGVLASKAKYIATEAGLHVTAKAIQLVGGRGAYRDYPVERAFRDLRTCTLMTPTPDRMLETIGKSALGIDTGMLDVAAGPGRAPRPSEASVHETRQRTAGGERRPRRRPAAPTSARRTPASGRRSVRPGR
jgi:alkylation response protein AidB-like acyl-CoA dehydrogenase